MNESEFMRLAVEEMKKCTAFPKIGAVVAKNGKLLSTGYRNEVGEKHAERIALEKISAESAVGSTLYTTLEPCVKISQSQKKSSCSELIVKYKIKEVWIGSFDPNGRIYANGWKMLRDNDIAINFFNSDLQSLIQTSTFKYGDFNAGYGSGSRRVRLVENRSKKFTIYFSKNDNRKIDIQWNRLSQPKDLIDLSASTDSIRIAEHASTFQEITDPLTYHDPTYFARLAVGKIAVVFPKQSKMLLLIRIKDISETDIEFQWEVRNKR